MMPLTQKQKKTLRNLSHDLKPVVMVGQNGLTDSVLNEFELSIDHHELIKVKISVGDRDQRKSVVSSIAERTGSELVHSIGNMAVYYRRNPDRNQINPGKP